MNTPTLRFKEFSGEWEVKKLGAETTWSSGGTPSKQEESYWDGDIPWISASSMRGFKYFDSDLKITNAGLSNGSRLAAKGSLLLLVRGSMLFNKIPVGIATKDVAFNQDVKSIKAKPSINNEFLLYWFFASENKLLNMVSGTGIGAGKLDTQDLLAMDLSVPTLPEQTKIANFLTAIDEKIAQLSQTAQLLTDYKKGVMQQIFSQQLRFKDDDGREFAEWEVKTIEQIADVKGGKRLAKGYSLQNENNGIPYITVSDMYQGGVDIENIKYVPHEIAESIKNYKIRVNDIFISVAGTLGIVGIVPSELDNANLTENANKLTNLKCNQQYLLQYLMSDRLEKLIDSVKTTSAQPKLAIYALNGFEISLPSSLKEQTKIANFLTAIDDKINNNQTQLDAMKQYKAGLLQQMFV